MTGKVKLTREQAEAVKLAVADYGSNNVLDMHAETPYWITKLSSLDNLSPSELARALYIGYEVEEEYKVGDWVFSNLSKTSGKVVRVGGNFVELDGGATPSNQYIRHATPEEIKAEQERRVWAKISREVGEFRIGDGYQYHDGVTHAIDTEDRLRTVELMYRNGRLEGFYPVESFISFGGADDVEV